MADRQKPNLWGLFLAMKLTATTLLLCLLSAALVIGSLFGYFKPLPFLTEHKYWLMAAGWAVLFSGITFKGE